MASIKHLFGYIFFGFQGTLNLKLDIRKKKKVELKDLF